MLNDGLRDILAKQPVVSTKLAEQLLLEPQEVEHAYLEHYHTHVPLGDTDDFVKRLVERTRQAKTPQRCCSCTLGLWQDEHYDFHMESL